MHLFFFLVATKVFFFGSDLLYLQVEDELSGLSNFIPVLFSDKEVCSEMRKMQQTVDESFLRMDPDFSGTNSLCETHIRAQAAISEFLVDIGWLLKEPPSENLYSDLSASQIQRLVCLLNFLIENESTVILERILLILWKLIDEFEAKGGNGGSDGADIDILKTKMEFARDFLCPKLQRIGATELFSGFSALSSPSYVLSAVEVNQVRMSLPNIYLCINHGLWIINSSLMVSWKTVLSVSFPFSSVWQVL